MTDRSPVDLLGLDDRWPRPGSVVFDAARARGFSGEIEVATFPRLRVYLDAGEVYFAERVSDPPLGARLVEAGVLTGDELDRGALRIGDAEHLGHLFERVPSLDRHVVLAALDGINDEALSWAANERVSHVAVTAYRRHPSGIHRWRLEWPAPAGPVRQPLPPPPPDAVPTPGPAPWLRIVEVEHLDDDVRIEWAHPSMLEDRLAAPPVPFSRPPTPPPAHPFLPPSVGEVAPLPPPPGVAGPDEPGPAPRGSDAFELIWPTGEVDEQFLGGPLSQMPAPGAPLDDLPQASELRSPHWPTTLQLRPLTLPADETERAPADAVSEEVVLAIQRAIAAIAASPMSTLDGVGDAPLPHRHATAPTIDEPRHAGERVLASGASPSAPTAAATDQVGRGTPEPSVEATHIAHDDERREGARVIAADELPTPVLPPRVELALAPSAPTDARRTALKRLIGGLRKR